MPAGSAWRSSVENVDVARMFQQIADVLELCGENAFRIRAYRNAARTLESLIRRAASSASAPRPRSTSGR